MASPTNFGASIIAPPKPAADDLPLPPRTLDSPALTPAASREDLADKYTDRRRVPPHSPFYQHPPASFERVHTRTNSKPSSAAAGNEKDLEAGISTPLTAPRPLETPFTSKVSIDCNKECKMWPSKNTLLESKMAEKRKKRRTKIFGGCAPVVERWQRQSTRTRLVMKILFAVFVLGVVVAIAVGITVAVNGSVYVSDGKSKQIPDPGAS